MFSFLNFFFLTVLVAFVSSQTVLSPYAPTYVPCPEGLSLRSARSGLSPQELEWRKLRLSHVVGSIGSYLHNAKIPQFDVDLYLDKINASTVPIAGMAISGGGSQSGMGGLGLWQALDDRYEPAVKAGTGGLAQCLSYISGLSGGAIYTIAPLASNNFSSLNKLRNNSDLTTNYLIGKTGNQTEYFTSFFENAVVKLREGFPASVTDILGQAVGQFLAPSWIYKGFSDVASTPDHAFALGSAPMPIVTFTEVIPGSSPDIGSIMYPDVNNATIYEQTPLEFGSWLGGRVQGFIPTRFLGTAMENGRPTKADKCVNGFDKMTFAGGSTGNAWNFWFIDEFFNIPLFYKRDVAATLGARADPPNSSILIPPNQATNPDVQLVEGTAQILQKTFNETMWATYPNPFLDFNEQMQNVDDLLLVDGSESGETIPLRPLIVPAREVDFIVAFDASGENPDNSWVNGTTFAQTAKAAKRLDIPFPDVPDAATFINLRLNQYPTFFGCPSPSSPSKPKPEPLVLYIPNAPWSAYTNFSYRTAEFTNKQLDLVFNNSLNMITFGCDEIKVNPSSVMGAHGAGVPDDLPPFSACIACGMIYKSLARIGQQLPKSCESCFEAHCWNGTVVDRPSNPTYSPGLLLGPGVSYKEWSASVWSSSGQ